MSFCMCPFLHQVPNLDPETAIVYTTLYPACNQKCWWRPFDVTFEYVWSDLKWLDFFLPFCDVVSCCIPVGQLHLVLWQLHHVSITFSGLQKHLLGAESRYKGTDAMYHNVKMLRSIRIPFHPRSAWERLLKCGVVLEHSWQSLEGSIDFYDFPWCSMRY